MTKLRLALDNRRHRALIYILVSAAVGLPAAFGDTITRGVFFFINIVQLMLVPFLLLFDRPRMSDAYAASSANATAYMTSYALYVITLFVEIYLICELIVSMKKRRVSSRTQLRQRGLESH